MICRVMICLVLFAAATFGAESDEQTRAREAALNLAGAFTNDGFKMRDGHWSGTVAAGGRTLIAVNLYAGNHYWFSAATSDGGRKVSVEVLDENGRPITADNYNGEGATAAGISPANSGQYFVSLAVDGGSATCCVLYSYK